MRTTLQVMLQVIFFKILSSRGDDKTLTGVKMTGGCRNEKVMGIDALDKTILSG